MHICFVWIHLISCEAVNLYKNCACQKTFVTGMLHIGLIVQQLKLVSVCIAGVLIENLCSVAVLLIVP